MKEEMGPASKREIFAWAMYDFANSGYTTVVLTTIFNAWFVGRIAGHGDGSGTLLWTLAMSAANLIVLATAPILGAMADRGACKRRYLAVTTVGCVLGTALLGFAGEGDVVFAWWVVMMATVMFASGENLIAAFLPEIAAPGDTGRISGYGWSLGYLGGMLVLAVCLAWVSWAESVGRTAAAYVPVTLWITAGAFALASLPTFAWLRERGRPASRESGDRWIRDGFLRVRDTVREAHRHRDLFRFLLALALYYCGIQTVIVLAAVYAQEVMGFSTKESIVMIMIVNGTAAAGALIFGHLQDRLGSVRVLSLTLFVWIAALGIAVVTETRAAFWVVANLVGLALGSSQSAGRALVALFSPAGRSAEFFGLWGLAGKLAAAVGPLVYGGVAWVTGGDHRLALGVTAAFFVAGLAVLWTVDERRGIAAARL